MGDKIVVADGVVGGVIAEIVPTRRDDAARAAEPGGGGVAEAGEIAAPLLLQLDGGVEDRHDTA